VLEAALVPLSPQAEGADLSLLITGGDDYELLFALPPGALPPGNMAATRIGHFTAGPPGVLVLDNTGQPMALSHQGWSHF
jgi:thiamine-monophosphate kinase